MSSMRSETGPSGYRYHFIDDFSGNILMDVPAWDVEKETDISGQESYSVTLDVSDVEWLAGLIARSKQIDKG